MSQKHKPGSRPGNAHQRVTLKTLAELTGLSLSTVSLSLRGGTTLKQETRQRVMDAAQSLGYVPDRAGCACAPARPMWWPSCSTAPKIPSIFPAR
ncbi:LacI family DNA-binding transcriptional regulator [Devosia sp. A8/3-2]|nr:LacI family DNA-binding transcriptional regulator [Devosia sp. A8/3-2]